MTKFSMSTTNVQWKTVVVNSPPDTVPRARSLHCGVTLNNSLFIFGGFDGSARLNDLHRFDFSSSVWTHVVPANGLAPSPRDRLAATTHKDSIYIFGGFDGTSRVSDLWKFDTSRTAWSLIDPVSGTPPSARHSHSAVEWNGKLYVLFGYDGNYRNDISEFSTSRRMWMNVQAKGSLPKPRYRSSAVVYRDKLFIFGGHDGSRHLDDLNAFDFKTASWTLIEPVIPLRVMGPYAFRTITPSASNPPAPRDSHSAVVYGDSMFVFGGSTGVARNDFFEYRFDLNAWIELQPHVSDNVNPGPRFCHVAAVNRDSMYVFAGYDGQSRLGDFRSYSFTENIVLEIPAPTILYDLKSMVNKQELSDISLCSKEDGTQFYGHKIILQRCPYFAAMFGSTMSETCAEKIELSDISGPVLGTVLQYLYSDELDASTPDQTDMMALFTAADRYGLERLQKICEQTILASISVERACTIFQAADVVNATTLRKKAIEFIARNYDAVVKTEAFEELARTNVELTLEIIRHQR
jgi:N-acetylneuraminic acid mutarotase